MTVPIAAGQNTLNITMNLIMGILDGIVKDQANAPLQGVAVAMTGAAGNGTATTDANGHYGITGIVPGPYTFTFTKAGYSPETR